MKNKAFLALYLASSVALATNPPGGNGGGSNPQPVPPGNGANFPGSSGGFGPGGGAGFPGGGNPPPNNGGGGIGGTPPPGIPPGGSPGQPPVVRPINVQANARAIGQGGAGGQAVVNNYGGYGAGAYPANQRIEYVNVPSLGAMYTPGVNPCTMSFSGQGVGMGGGGGITTPFYSLPCHFQELAKTNASIGVAAVNIGAVSAPGIPANNAVVAAGQNAVVDALDLLAGTDVNLYLLRKAQGRTPPIRPDRGFMDSFPGGLMDQHVLPDSNYVKPVANKAPAYVPPPIPDSRADNPKYDRFQEQEMLK
jgi:hypothetical protein